MLSLPGRCLIMAAALALGGPVHAQRTSLKYYEIDTIAAAGRAGITGLSDGPSISGKGEVAFVAVRPEGESIYLSDPAGTSDPVDITPGFASPAVSFWRAVQLNDNGATVAVDRRSASPPRSWLRAWSRSGTFTTYAEAPAARFDVIFGFASINNSGAVAYTALKDTDTVLVVQDAPAGRRIEKKIAATSVRPVIADNGTVVVKSGDLPDSPIVLWDRTLGSAVMIATATQFSELGSAPGMSADGRVIAFYGSITATAARAIGTHPGPGIFASIAAGGARTIYRINSASVEAAKGLPCVPGNACIAAGIATDRTGQAIDFADYARNTRVAVIAQDFATRATSGVSVTVAYIATPNGGAPPNNPFTAGKQGIFTSRLDISADKRVRLARAIPVLQAGDKVQGRTVLAVGMNDALASADTGNDGKARKAQPGDHRLAFWANTDGGQAIYRASYLDSDGDALPDHWETGGIDVDGDGNADLALPGANRFRKDLYLELDYMAAETRGAAYVSKPPVAALDAVIGAFDGAPVANPLDGSGTRKGISLHVDSSGENRYLDEEVPFVDVLSPSRLEGPLNDIFDFKLGTEGDLCGSAFFGTAAQRKSPSCVAIAAKRLAYRYGVFAHKYLDRDGKTGSSGVATGHATVPGGLFIVTLGAWDPYVECADPLPAEHTFAGVTACGQRELNGATLLHEFGHTLGLGHGSQDDVNCKPNYFSVMNYLFQMPRQVDAKRPLDFARTRALPLDESRLDEQSSSGAGGSRERRTGWGTPAGDLDTGPAAGKTDWNSDGDHDPGTVSADINRIAPLSCDGVQQGTALAAGSDWDNLLYDLRFGAGMEESGGALLVAPQPELTREQFEAAARAADSDGDGVANLADNCPLVANPGQEDTGSIGIGNACRKSANPPADITGDGLVNCTDLSIVKSRMGRKAGDADFDERADVVRDGIVNVRDLTLVARALPADLKCE